MSCKQTILIVEDDKVLMNFLNAILTTDGYAVLKSSHGSEAISMAASHRPDLLLLDLGLPDMDGLEVIRNLREWSELPIIVLSARHHEMDKVEALDLGASDYVTKPFGNNELLARVRSALRNSAMPKAAEQNHRFCAGSLCVDFSRREVLLDGVPVYFTRTEYKIIAMLAKNAGKVLTHEYIINEVWGQYSGDNQILRVNMANIRRLIEANPADPKYIRTVMGVGYRMVEGD